MLFKLNYLLLFCPIVNHNHNVGISTAPKVAGLAYSQISFASSRTNDLIGNLMMLFMVAMTASVMVIKFIYFVISQGRQ